MLRHVNAIFATHTHGSRNIKYITCCFRKECLGSTLPIRDVRNVFPFYEASQQRIIKNEEINGNVDHLLIRRAWRRNIDPLVHFALMLFLKSLFELKNYYVHLSITKNYKFYTKTTHLTTRAWQFASYLFLFSCPACNCSRFLEDS